MRRINKGLLISSVMLVSMFTAACGSPQAADNGAASDSVQTVTGTATMTWHNTTKFVAAVEVSIAGDVIQGVTVRDGSVISTDAFEGWSKGREEYLAQYNGKTVEQILALEAKAPENPADHHDGGSVSGEIDAVSGATASSTIVAMAVKNAVEKVEESGV